MIYYNNKENKISYIQPPNFIKKSTMIFMKDILKLFREFLVIVKVLYPR